MELSAHYQKISELTERLSVLFDHLELEEKQDRLEEVKLELENPDVCLLYTSPSPRDRG